MIFKIGDLVASDFFNKDLTVVESNKQIIDELCHYSVENLDKLFDCIYKLFKVKFESQFESMDDETGKFVHFDKL